MVLNNAEAVYAGFPWTCACSCAIMRNGQRQCYNTLATL